MNSKIENGSVRITRRFLFYIVKHLLILPYRKADIVCKIQCL